jgi:Arm DNA-binding domain
MREGENRNEPPAGCHRRSATVQVLDRKAGKHVVRYRLTVDAGTNPETGRRQQVRRHHATEKEARAALAEIVDQAGKG